MLRISARFFHSTGVRCAATEKSALAALRKSTGYTFANCKKALELHNNDVKEAEKWLKAQAQELGWTKANKLEGRNTTQGLVGILIEKNIGALVEVNCETDFVARNSEFQAFLELSTKSCIQYMSSIDSSTNLTKIGIGNDALKNIQNADGKPLSDHLALLIGKVGENASLKRAICYKVPESIHLVSYAHSAADLAAPGSFLKGKYGVIAAFRATADDKLDIQKNILQHIVGMNPQKVGNKEKDEPAKNKDDETCLIFQEYLLDPDMQVGDVLEEHGLEILDFQRFECGEVTQSSNENS